MVPPGVEMLPELLTRVPISETLPPGAATIEPSLRTAPEPPGAAVNTARPVSRSAVLAVRVLATRLPTSTTALRPKMMPEGLMRKTEPGAVMSPRISDGLLDVTRLTVIAAAEGWLKRTASPAPMLKLRQSIAALPLAWSITRLLPPAPRTTAWPATTVGSVGSAKARGHRASSRAATSGRRPVLKPARGDADSGAWRSWVTMTRPFIWPEARAACPPGRGSQK